MNKLKVLELFGGIGSPRKALENIGIEQKNIDYVEIFDYAVFAYNKLFDHEHKPQDIRGWNNNVDILIHGSPCQDWSTAGKNDLTTGRSLLYLETLEIIKSRLNPRPKYVVWENVKGLISKKNYPFFQHYLDEMTAYGYTNHYKILNSINFGIPQSRNRIFVVSIRNDLDTQFNWDNLELKPLPKLKEFLDQDVDLSYYITQKSMTKAIESGKIKIINDHCETITTAQFRWNNAGVVKIPLHAKNFISTDKIHNIDEVMSTIGSNSANNRIAIPILEVNKEFDYRMSDGSKRPIGKINEQGNITIPLTTNHTANKIGVDVAMTITTNANTSKIAELILKEPIPNVPIFIIEGKPYHLRVLTPRECWRLMGWKDVDIDKIIKDVPKTHLYKLAGNAIVIQVLEAIFKELFKEILNG